MTRIESRDASEAHWISTSTSRIRVRPCQCPGSNATWGWDAKNLQGAPCWVVFQGKPRGNQYCRGAKVLFLRAYCGWLFAFHVAAPKKSWLKPQRFLAGKGLATSSYSPLHWMCSKTGVALALQRSKRQPPAFRSSGLEIGAASPCLSWRLGPPVERLE